MKNRDGCDDHRNDETCDCALVASVVAENMPKATTKRRLTWGPALIDQLARRLDSMPTVDDADFDIEPFV